VRSKTFNSKSRQDTETVKSDDIIRIDQMLASKDRFSNVPDSFRLKLQSKDNKPITSSNSRVEFRDHFKMKKKKSREN
jgi:hypothetical protein